MIGIGFTVFVGDGLQRRQAIKTLRLPAGRFSSRAREPSSYFT